MDRLTRQYRTPVNLEARAALHERFSTNPVSWQDWVFSQLPLQVTTHVLEVGAGPGWLWRANRKRLPSGLSALITDRS